MTEKNKYQEKKQRNMVAYVFLTFLTVLLLANIYPRGDAPRKPL